MLPNVNLQYFVLCIFGFVYYTDFGSGTKRFNFSTGPASKTHQRLDLAISRGVNWDESSKQYPWVVLVKRETFVNWEKAEIEGEEDERLVEPAICGGAFISNKHGFVITAAHCICNYDDMGVYESPVRCFPREENQIKDPENNDIYIEMGSNNREKLIEINTRSAFVMHVIKRKQDGKENIELQANPDIGIIRVNMDEIREHKLIIESLNLPKEDDNYLEKSLKVTSWGTTFDESEVTIDDKKITISSCVTGYESMPENQFMPCNVQQIRKNNGCFGWPPPDPDYAKQCQVYWEEAKNTFSIDMRSTLKSVTAIKIAKSSSGTTRSETHCINPEIFEKKGWCETIDSKEEKKKWGICSPSCRFLKQNPENHNNEDPVNQQDGHGHNNWDVDEITGDINPRVHHERIVQLALCPPETHISKLQWNLCVEPKYPEYAVLNVEESITPNVAFIGKVDGDLVKMMASKPAEKLKEMGLNNFYQGFSWGDCGAPVWDETTKTLVAVVRGGVAPPNTPITEKIPSGFNIDFVTSITYPTVLEFINQLMRMYS